VALDATLAPRRNVASARPAVASASRIRATISATPTAKKGSSSR